MSANSTDRRVDSVLLVATEVLLMAVTLAAVASFGRVFVDNSWVSKLAVAVIVAHVTVAVMRRLQRGLLLTGIVTMVAMMLQVTWTHYRFTTTAGLPTAGTRDAVDIDITAAWNLFSEVKAPAEVAVGFVVIATIAIWVIAYLADWAAFRLWSSVETVLPSFAMFVFVAFFGTDTNQYRYAALYLAALLTFQLFHRLMRQSQEVRWLAGTQRVGTQSLLAAGSVVVVLGVLGAMVAGPALPGADQEAIIDLDQRSNGPDTRVVLSPIVDIRGRLVDQADVEAFTVRTDTPSYWRLASLDRFDGQIWGADNKYSRASGSLPDDFAVEVDVEISRQQIDVLNLGAVWIPAAFEPRSIIETSDDSISYEPTSGTLIVGRELESSNGLIYTVESALPRFDPVALAAAPNAYPPEILERYLGLPDDFSPRASILAREITAGSANDYERALALQNYFREFSYNVNVGEGHSSNRIDQFLDTREGYCEQFAGSFAAMARALNIPSRVAVGFTWGEQDPDDPQLYHVRGEHAHAWPEVYIPGSGWVPFEPTPTRGAPGAELWTDGVTPAQAGVGGQTETLPTPIPTTGTNVPEDAPGVPELAAPNDSTSTGVGVQSDGTPGWLRNAGLVLAALAAIGLLYVLAVTMAKRTRYQRSFHGATDNRGRVQAVWSDAAESLRPLGIARRPEETVAEFARRAGAQSPATKSGMAELGVLTVAARYGPSIPSDPTVDRATALRDQVQTAVVGLTTPTERWRDRLDPRPLLRR